MDIVRRVVVIAIVLFTLLIGFTLIAERFNLAANIVDLSSEVAGLMIVAFALAKRE